MFDYPQNKYIFLNTSLKPRLVQLCAAPVYAVISYKGEDTGTSLSISLPQKVVANIEVASPSPFL